MPPVLRCSAQKGRATLTLTCIRMGEDLCVTLAGGDREHIGAVALAQACASAADPAHRTSTCSVLALPGHREDGLARTLASRLSAALGATVCVACGIHLEAIASAEIEDVLAMAEELGAELLRRLALGDGKRPARATS
ncbi:MAG TPA: hypothetical protein VN436_13380 [Holophaga sp.]|nr:hypothetical protein [Holophaga sp.]